MCNGDTAWPTTESGSGILVDHLIALSGAHQADHITVAGRNTLDVLLGLCRRGFLHATCRTAVDGPHAGDDAAASLWILNAENAAEMRTLIAMCGRDLRSDGTLIINLDFLPSVEKSAPLRDLLIKCGFVPVQQIHATNRDLLLCARKGRLQQTLAA